MYNPAVEADDHLYLPLVPMMASILSHRQSHMQVAISEANKESEQAKQALEQLNQALEMNRAKIQQLVDELHATQRAASQYSKTIPSMVHKKQRMDEKLKRLQETADRVAKELAAERLVQSYLQELRNDDDESERRLKTYLCEVLKKDAEGGDSDSDSDWSVLGESVDSLKVSAL